MDARKLAFAALAALLAWGCGAPQTARIGGPEEKGVYRKSIETSHETGVAVSDRVHEDDKLLNGG